MNSSGQVNVLLVEDNPAEIRIITEIFKENAINFDITSVKDGMEAMDYLNKIGKYKNCKTPSLILLDLNLPKKNGLEVLEEIKNDNMLKCIPVIVLTNSSDDNDITDAYIHYASAYIVKPVDLDTFSEYIDIIKHYWFNYAVLPKKSND